MNNKTLKALLEAGAVKKVRIIGDGSQFHVEVDTPTSSSILHTQKGALKSWGTLDAAARWLHGLGIGTCQLELGSWQPGQKGMKF